MSLNKVTCEITYDVKASDGLTRIIIGRRKKSCVQSLILIVVRCCRENGKWLLLFGEMLDDINYPDKHLKTDTCNPFRINFR